MTFDLKRIVEAKRNYRRELAARPIAEKLAMLDALRERAVLLRGATAGSKEPRANAVPRPKKQSLTVRDGPG